MKNQNEDLIIDIEYVLCAYARPTFLSISDPDEHDGRIEILISSNVFDTMSIQQRITYVFNLLNSYIPDIIYNTLIIVNAHTNDEIEEILEEIFQDHYTE